LEQSSRTKAKDLGLRSRSNFAEVQGVVIGSGARISTSQRLGIGSHVSVCPCLQTTSTYTLKISHRPKRTCGVKGAVWKKITRGYTKLVNAYSLKLTQCVKVHVTHQPSQSCPRLLCSPWRCPQHDFPTIEASSSVPPRSRQRYRCHEYRLSGGQEPTRLRLLAVGEP
jgi:hypothetical protein